MKIAVQMDHISSIKIASDTTFALCLEAARRKYKLYHYTPDRLAMRDGFVWAHVENLEVRDIEKNHFTLGALERCNLAEMDLILLRQDPPFDMNYITSTYLLEHLHQKTLVVNHPVWVRNSPEKIFVTEFPDLIPETLITKNPREVEDFRREFGDIILKPLYGNGGAGVFHLTSGDRNLASLLEMFSLMFREPFIVQRYLKEVRTGDKRIILIDGEPVGAINRVPAEHDARSNLHAGGRAEPAQLTMRDREICTRIGLSLKERGFLLVGIDVIGDYLTEINVTSPTGLREINRFGGVDIAALFWNRIEDKWKEGKSYKNAYSFSCATE